MGNTHGPGQKFTFFGIAAAAHGINDADENILENIFGQVFVFDQEQDGCIELILVAKDKGFQGIKISICKKTDQFMVGFFH